MSIEDMTDKSVSEQDIGDAIQGVQSALVRSITSVPIELAVQLPNILRCLQELCIWRVGSDLPIKEATPQEQILLKTLLPSTRTDVQQALALSLLREATRLCRVTDATEVATRKAITDQCYEAIRALHKGSKD